jgi:hypothetical protein
VEAVERQWPTLEAAIGPIRPMVDPLARTFLEDWEVDRRSIQVVEQVNLTTLRMVRRLSSTSTTFPTLLDFQWAVAEDLGAAVAAALQEHQEDREDFPEDLQEALECILTVLEPERQGQMEQMASFTLRLCC